MEQKTQEKGKNEEKIIRIMSTDIEGKIKVYPGLAKVKGISWAVSNAICKILKIDKKGSWFFHISGHMLLNGSSGNPKLIPTSLSLNKIIEIVKSV